MSSSADPPPETTGRTEMRSPRSLRRRFVLAISMLVAVVLISLALVLVLTSRRSLRQDIEQRAESHAALAAGPICDAYETYYHSGYSKFRELTIDVGQRNPDLERFAIYDTSGRRLFGSEELERSLLQPQVPAEQAVADPRLLAAIRGLDLVAWRIEGSGSSPLFRVVTPYVEEWGRHRYTVVFDVSYDSLHAATRQVAVRLLWLTVASLGLGIFIAAVLARQSLEPLEELISGAQDLAEGNLERRITLKTQDEFESLARTFNHMASRLAASISDLEESNRALQSSNLELKEMDRFKSDLLANVSHELRTPLTSLKGYSEAMAEGLLGPITEAQQEALEVGQRNIQRLLTMIDELLSFALFESRSVKIEPGAVDLERVAQQAVETVRNARGPELDLRLIAEGDLPLVRGDVVRLTQVLDNLLTNAVNFTPDGGAITLRLARQGSQVVVEVTDSGVGIPSEELGRIFDRFYQVESTATRRHGGIGLGLSIVRQILDAHGCAIEVESELGRGTTFRFRLPVVDDALPPASGVGPRVVVVDDDSAFAAELARFLEQRGLEVRVAGSFQGAERLVRDFGPEAVVLDRLLPDGDGFDLLSQWRRQEGLEGMGVVVVSVRREGALARRLGADGYLVKPAEPAQVLRSLVPLLPSLMPESSATAGGEAKKSV